MLPNAFLDVQNFDSLLNILAVFILTSKYVNFGVVEKESLRLEARDLHGRNSVPGVVGNVIDFALVLALEEI